jgi:hypothetical protein
VIHQAGGAVNGQVLVLDVGANRLADVREWLWQRENKPKRHCIKDMRLAGLDHVLYCDIESNIRDADMNADSLAKFAIESLSSKPERNGIAYLARNIEMVLSLRSRMRIKMPFSDLRDAVIWTRQSHT